MKNQRIYNLLTSPVVATLFILVIFILISFNRVMNTDEGMWSYIGRVWTENHLPPYSGTIENKTPGIFELYAISHCLFGVNTIFVRILGGMAVLLTSLIVFFIGRKLHSHLAGIFGMYVCGMTMAWYLLDGPYTSQTETFMALFSTLSFYFALKAKANRRWFCWILLAGCSMGLSIAFKQIAVTTAVALAFAVLFYTMQERSLQQKTWSILLLIAGIAVSTVITLIPLFISGVTLKEYFDGAWMILLNSGSSANKVTRLYGFFRIWLNSRMIIFYPVLLLIILQRDLLKSRYFFVLLIWLLFDFAGVNASGLYWGHQLKQLIPSLSILTGILLSGTVQKLMQNSLIKLKHISIFIILFIFTLLPFQDILINGYFITAYSNDEKEIGLWLKRHTNKNDHVYISGDSGTVILSFSERVSSSKYFNTVFTTSDAEREVLLSDLKKNPPKYFLRGKTDKNSGEKIQEYIADKYTRIASLKFFEIYQLK